MAAPAACNPALVGKSKVDSGASAVVKASADLLTRDGVSDMSTRLGGGGTTGSIWLGGGCATWGDGFRLGTKGMVGSTPNQDILFYLVPWDEASLSLATACLNKLSYLMHTPTGYELNNWHMIA